MIEVIFQIPEVGFQSASIMMPAVPRVGEQIFLSDFISIGEEEAIFAKNKTMNLDSLIVKHVTWLKGKNDKKCYVLITLIL